MRIGLGVQDEICMWSMMAEWANTLSCQSSWVHWKSGMPILAPPMHVLGLEAFPWTSIQSLK